VPEVIKFFSEKLCDDHSKFEDHFSIIKRSDFSKLPKCLIIAAELDPVRDESVNYHAKLNEVGIESDLKIIRGVIHGYFSQPHLFKEAFNETITHVVEFMNRIHRTD
jgi:acetyl esterase/lipase